jgi:hypothetical protein
MTDQEIDYTFPPLPTPEEVKYFNFQGPIPESNKVVEGIYAGAFPGNISDEITNMFLTHILNCNVDKFVCLQKEYPKGYAKTYWRSYGGIRPYFDDVQRILKNKDKYDLKACTVDSATFVHLPIQDLKTAPDYYIIILAKKLVREYYHGARMYIHCWGGHGRTGVLICIMLHIMYGLTAKDALAYCEAVHSKRTAIPYIHGTRKLVTSPQTPEQFSQVYRVIYKLQFNKSILANTNEPGNT